MEESGFALLLLFLSVIVNPCINFELKTANKVITFNRFDGKCRRNKDTIMTTEWQAIKIVGRKLVMNGTITVKEDIEVSPKITLNIQKCRSRENPDSCENFYSYSTERSCEMMESKPDMWGPFLESFDPPWKCPQKKGTYNFVNASWDMTPLLLLSIDRWYWKSTVEQFDGKTGKMIACADAAAVVSNAN